MTEAMVIGNDRRIVFDGEVYKIQSRGQYVNSPRWSTIIVMEPEEVNNIMDFVEGL